MADRIPALIDQFGNPIPPDAIARLRETQAAATLAGVRPVMSGSPADGMTPRRLASIHRAAAEGDSLAYMELAEDIEERDLHYLGVLSTRRRQVSQLPIQVEAASEDPEHERQADFLRAWIKRGILENALFDMLDAIGKGYSVTEIDWEVGPDGILPRALDYRSPRWFEVSRADGETVMMRDMSQAALASTPMPPAGLVQSGMFGAAGAAYPGQIGLVPLADHKFLVHKHKAKSGILLRAGIARVASWAWMYKAFTQRDWAIFVQNYGMPIRVGRYGPEASPQDHDVLWSAVANIAGDCAAIIPRSMEIEFVKLEGTTAAAELYEKRCSWLDLQVSKLVLGQTTTTDAVSGGHAVAKEHRLVQEDIERADARGLSVTVVDPAHVGHKAEPAVGPGKKASTKTSRQTLAPRTALPDVVDPELIDALTRRTTLDMQGALQGLTDQVRAAIEAASDMQNLWGRLEQLQLDPAEFQAAMQRGMAVGFLTGQAALLDELRNA